MSDDTPIADADGTDRPSMPASGRRPAFDEATEIGLVGEALERLLEDETALPELEEALHTGDTDAFRGVLERHDMLDRIDVVCRWICTWHVQRRCRWVCREQDLVAMDLGQLHEATLGLARLASREGALEEVVEAIDRGDGDRFAELLEPYGLKPHCRLVCVLVLTVRCELFCIALGGGDDERPRELVAVLTDLLGAVGRLATEQRLTTVVEQYEAGRFDEVRRHLDDLRLGRWCRLVCIWLCVVVPYLHCVPVCLRFPVPPLERLPRSGDPGPIREWAKTTATLARRGEQVQSLLGAIAQRDDDRVAALVRELGLAAWCHHLCFWLHRVLCYRRCFLVCPPRPPLPLFYRLGGYPFPTQVDTGPGGSGLTTAEGRAFFGTVRLNGSDLQQTYAGGRPEYRFEVDTGAGWAPVLPHQIAPTRIGSWTRAGAPPREYVVNGNPADPDVIVVTPAADGWIQVPTEDSYWTAEGAFTSNGDFIRLRTTTVVPGTTHHVGTVDGGDPVPATALGANRAIGIRMRWREVGDTGDGLVTGTAHVVAVNNDRWDDVAKGGAWLSQRVDGQLAVVSVDVDEIGPGCEEIDDELHVRYTAAHPQLGSVSLSMSGPVPVTLAMTDDPAATPVDRFGVASSTPAPSDLPACSYLVTLRASLLLTTGDSAPDPVHDQIAFHVEHP